MTERALFRRQDSALRLEPRAAMAYGAILLLGVALFWISHVRPALMPLWGPFEFVWWQYLGAALGLYWYLRGLVRVERRPALWQQAAFLSGLLVVYAALQTHFDYMAQHLFAFNRTQAVLVHDLGPFLIALSSPSATIVRGAPGWTRRVANSGAARALRAILGQPFVAAGLSVGIFYFWLVPPIHFRAMLDARVYSAMNASMVLDGLLFWLIVLDARPQPPAQWPFGIRAAMAFGVMTPQTLLGAVITLAPRDLYPSYTLCGRLFPIDAMTDQHLGGLISWIPPLLIGAGAILILLWRIMKTADPPPAAVARSGR